MRKILRIVRISSCIKLIDTVYIQIHIYQFWQENTFWLKKKTIVIVRTTMTEDNNNN